MLEVEATEITIRVRAIREPVPDHQRAYELAYRYLCDHDLLPKLWRVSPELWRDHGGHIDGDTWMIRLTTAPVVVKQEDTPPHAGEGK